MPKHNLPTSQPSMFKKAIQQMPEGYYSSGPNPNLRLFVDANSTTYDAETDDYRVKPFVQPIITTKASQIYNMHAYWSKKPFDAIQKYIRHYTKPGDLVLDPFCGSGSTALAAIIEGRSTIAIDLSPAATLITRTYTSTISELDLNYRFEQIKKHISHEIDWLYETRCDHCDGNASILYTVYSLVVRCPRCLEKVPIFDAVETRGVSKKGEDKQVKLCPYCYAKGINEEIGKPGCEHLGNIPVLTSYMCLEGCSPARKERSHKDTNPKKRKCFEEFDLRKIREIEGKVIPYWYPEADLASAIPYRMLVKKDFRKEDASNLTDFFTKRNLWALAAFLHNVKDNDDLRAVINSAIMASSRRAQHLDEGGGYIPGTYSLPPLSKERNVRGVIDRIFSKTSKARAEISQIVKTSNIIISTQSSTNLSDIPSNSIDYIFTDPPYAGNVQYGELNFLWEAWMGFDTSWYENEIIINPERNKTEYEWAHLLKLSMQECYRVLKSGRWLSLCYHDTSEGTWQLIQDIMAEVGFISETIESAIYIDTGGRTYNQYTADKVTKRDLVINFRKPNPRELTGQLSFFDTTDFITFQEAARIVLIEALSSHPGSGADRLYDELVSRLVRKGQFERHDFDQLLRSVAEPVSEARMASLFVKEQPSLFGTHEVVRWYLKASVDEVDEAENVKENDIARQLERFMVSYLLQNPEETGVHYSNLFETYLPIKDKPRRLLQELLPEFFFKTPEGTWRPPANDEERQQKTSLRSSGTLRRFKRFANALIDGVPPHEKDKPENTPTLADWIRQCRRAGLFELGRVLYEKGGLRFEELNEEMRLLVDEDYQICLRRAVIGAKKSKTKRVATTNLLE